MSKNFRPMLASPADLDNLRFPLLASPKLDGIRASVVGGQLLSRSLKPIPNKHVSALLSRPEYEGLDGELIVGEPTDPDVYRRTNSFVMAHDKMGEFTYFVFDLWDRDQPYGFRDSVLRTRAYDKPIRVHKSVELRTLDELDLAEEQWTRMGYEGIMLRDPNALYKFGRSTAREGALLKVKRFEDSEAEIIGIEEEMFNGNEAKTNELGRTKRSTAKAGLVGKGTMGALHMRDIHTGVEFHIGTGFTAAQRAGTWEVGSIHVYKFFPVGVKDKPRHPVYKGPRSKIDMGAPA